MPDSLTAGRWDSSHYIITSLVDWGLIYYILLPSPARLPLSNLSTPYTFQFLLNCQMASSRSSRTTKPSHGAMAYAPYIDERGRQYEPVDESRNYNPGAETSDSDDEDDTYVPPPLKRRRMVPSVSLHSRTVRSQEESV